MSNLSVLTFQIKPSKNLLLLVILLHISALLAAFSCLSTNLTLVCFIFLISNFYGFYRINWQHNPKQKLIKQVNYYDNAWYLLCCDKQLLAYDMARQLLAFNHIKWVMFYNLDNVSDKRRVLFISDQVSTFSWHRFSLFLQVFRGDTDK